MEKKTDLQHNKIHHLEDTVIVYGIYNSDTLTELIDSVLKCKISLCGKKKNLCRKDKSNGSTIFE